MPRLAHCSLVFAVAAATAPALAQSFDGRLGFRSDQGTISDPNINHMYVFDATGLTAPQTLNFSITVGAFDAQGFTNYGMVNWVGSITGTGEGFTIAPGGAQAALRGPFTFNPVGAGTVSDDGRSITGIDAARNIAGHQVLWFFGQPEPTDPPVLAQGNNSYYQTYRFSVTITDLTTPRHIVITASGFMQAVSGWTHLGSTEPLDENTPGNVTWAGTSTVTDHDVTGSFIIPIYPSPSTAVLLALGGLAATRRRR